MISRYYYNDLNFALLTFSFCMSPTIMQRFETQILFSNHDSIYRKDIGLRRHTFWQYRAAFAAKN